MQVPILRRVIVVSAALGLASGPIAATAAPADSAVPFAVAAASPASLAQENARLADENRRLAAALAKEQKENQALRRRVALLGAKTGAYRRQVRVLLAEIKKLKWRMSIEFGPWGSSVASTYGIGDGLLGSGLAGQGRLDYVRPVFAHKTMPFGTKVQFMYKGRTFIGECQDRGPFVAGREFDLGPRLARELGFGGVGVVKWRTIAIKK